MNSKTYKINHQFKCNEKCLVYLLTCEKCVGQTIDTFQHHWNNYKSNNTRFQCSEPCMQEYLYRCSSSPSHYGFLNVSVTFINKTDVSDHPKRKNVWRETLMTMASHGLNIEYSL